MKFKYSFSYEICALLFNYFAFFKLPKSLQKKNEFHQIVYQLILVNLICRHIICILFVLTKIYFKNVRNRFLTLLEIYDISWTAYAIFLLCSPQCFTAETSMHLPYFLLTFFYCYKLLLEFYFNSNWKIKIK